MVLRVKPKRSFIHKTAGNCEICGSPEWVLSTIAINFNYGSENDGERLKLNICGKCADTLFTAIQNREGEKNGTRI